METMVDQLNDGDPHRCTLRRSTTMLLALDRHTPSNIFKKESDRCCLDQMVLGFPLADIGKWKKGSHHTLQEGLMPPAGGTASMPSESTRISPEKILLLKYHNIWVTQVM
jgi:hypothetical protein